jgi:DNA-binding transcriptional ArsR family regulator
MVELLAHPLRLRILHAVRAGTRTTAEIRAALPDASKATLYRQIILLTRAGLLEVASQQRVRGQAERSYRLARVGDRVGSDTQPAPVALKRTVLLAAVVAALVVESDALTGGGRRDQSAGSGSHAATRLAEQDRKYMIDSVRQVIDRLGAD